MSTKWQVKYGIINNQDSLTSRDQGMVTKDTLEEARKWIHEEEAFLRSIGYKFWYINGPTEIQVEEQDDNGTQVNL